MRYLTLIFIKLKTPEGEIELKPGGTFKPKNEEAIKGLLAEGKVRPLSDVMAEKYRELTDWLHQFDLTGDEIKETLPSLYLNIQNAIENLDRAFVNEDMTAFQDALDRVKALSLRTQSVSGAICTADGVKKLKGLSKDSLKEIHKVKQVFSESNIEEIKKHVSGTQTEEIQN